jgi:putative transposase
MKSRPIFVDLCTRAKNLYNYATYQVRQEFFDTGKWLQYTTLYHQIKHEPVYLALKEISDSYLPQQVLRQIEQNWRSYFNAVKIWKKYPSKFQGQPRLPRYKPKYSLHMLNFPRPRVRIRGTEILCPQPDGSGISDFSCRKSTDNSRELYGCSISAVL